MIAAASSHARSSGQREDHSGEGLTIHVVGFLGADYGPGGRYQF